MTDDRMALAELLRERRWRFSASCCGGGLHLMEADVEGLIVPGRTTLC